MMSVAVSLHAGVVQFVVLCRKTQISIVLYAIIEITEFSFSFALRNIHVHKTSSKHN